MKLRDKPVGVCQLAAAVCQLPGPQECYGHSKITALERVSAGSLIRVFGHLKKITATVTRDRDRALGQSHDANETETSPRLSTQSVVTSK